MSVFSSADYKIKENKVFPINENTFANSRASWLHICYTSKAIHNLNIWFCYDC